MTPERATLSDGPRRLGSPYVLGWGLLALLAAAYLTALAVRPDLVSEVIPIFQHGEPEGNQGQRAMSKALAEVQGLRQSVSQVQLDVARLKTEMSVNQARETLVDNRLAEIERKIGGGASLAEASASAPPPAFASSAVTGATLPAVAPSRASAGEPPAPTATPAAKTASDVLSKETRAPAAPKPVKVVTIPKAGSEAAAATAAAIETGSIGRATSTTSVVPKLLNAPTDSPPAAGAATAAQAASAPAKAIASAQTSTQTVSRAAASAAPSAVGAAGDAKAAALVNFGPAVVTPAAAPVGVKISNGPSLEALRLSWSQLADRHSAQLGKLQPRYAARIPDNHGADPTFDLIAGPVKSEAEAKKLCKTLAAKGVACEIRTFSGPTL